MRSYPINLKEDINQFTNGSTEPKSQPTTTQVAALKQYNSLAPIGKVKLVKIFHSEP